MTTWDTYRPIYIALVGVHDYISRTLERLVSMSEVCMSTRGPCLYVYIPEVNMHPVILI